MEDPNQWAPSGASMQSVTPRAVEALGPQCVLMRFDWHHLEEALAPLPDAELAQIKETVQVHFDASGCGEQRRLYTVFATTPVGGRQVLIERVDSWYPTRAGHYLRLDTMLELLPLARLPALEVAEVCPDFEGYLHGRADPSAIPASGWRALLSGLRTLDAYRQQTGAGMDSCHHLFGISASDPDEVVEMALRLMPPTRDAYVEDPEGSLLGALVHHLGSVPQRARVLIVRDVMARHETLLARLQAVEAACRAYRNARS